MASEMSRRSPFRFSRVWEDHRLLSNALDVQADQDTVLCISSAGDNVLNLLLEKPKEIVAVDMNPAENALLELKIAAIKKLSYEDYLILLGDKEDTGQRRDLLFEQIKGYMPNYAQKYFSGETLRDGISTSGWYQKDTIEFVNKSVSKCVIKNDLDNFFKASSMEEQRKCFLMISSELEDAILSCLTREHVLSTGWAGKELIDIEALHGDVSQFFRKHIRRVCLTLPAKDNFYLSLWTRGTRAFSPDVNPELAPPFLQKKNFHKLKQLISRVEVFNGTVEDCITCPDVPNFNKVYLSNIFERLEIDLSQSMLQLIVDNIPSGGRMAYCTLLEPNKTPSAETMEKLTYLESLSMDLQKEDRMIIYSGFHVFSIN